MLNIRISDINELAPTLRRAAAEFLCRTAAAGLAARITETFRTRARQEELYAQGRTAPGNVVTWTLNSAHTHRVAFDICQNIRGREWDNSGGFFDSCGALWQEMGGTWGGNFRTPDRPHFEFTGGNPLGWFAAGNTLDAGVKMAWEKSDPAPVFLLSTMNLYYGGKRYSVPSVLVDGFNYPNLRALAEVLDLDVVFDDVERVVVLR